MSAGCAVEVVYRKIGTGRFLAHLDVMRAFERAVGRAGLPIEFTHGHNPRPRVVFAAPLGVGATGDAERVCIVLARRTAPADVLRSLVQQMPEGLPVVECRAIAGMRPPRYDRIPWADWDVTLAPCWPPESLVASLCAELLDREAVEVERRTKSGVRVVDIRRALLRLGASGPGHVSMRLCLNGECVAKPLEVIAALGLPTGDEHTPHPLVHRTALAEIEPA